MDAKQQNTTSIRAQAKQKTVIRKGPKWHLWKPQYVATNAQRQPLGNGSETAKQLNAI